MSNSYRRIFVISGRKIWENSLSLEALAFEVAWLVDYPPWNYVVVYRKSKLKLSSIEKAVETYCCFVCARSMARKTSHPYPGRIAHALIVCRVNRRFILLVVSVRLPSRLVYETFCFLFVFNSFVLLPCLLHRFLWIGRLELSYFFNRVKPVLRN